MTIYPVLYHALPHPQNPDIKILSPPSGVLPEGGLPTRAKPLPILSLAFRETPGRYTRRLISDK